MYHSKKSTRSISCFWFVTLAQGMVYKLRGLSDDDYMKKTDQAILIWSGNV